MVQKSQPPMEIVRLAQDLGLGVKSDPYFSIIEYCVKSVRQFISQHQGIDSLTGLLDCIANKADTLLIEIHADSDLVSVTSEYCGRDEVAFANLQNELAGETYGITYRLMHPQDGELQYVSIIDCRSSKAFRSYFTKWHEIAHLLTLTDQGRLVFRRTHPTVGQVSPEESLMDAIAGRIGFFDEIFHRFIISEISFFEIERLRTLLCPEASKQASIINFSKYWPSSCIRLEVGEGLKREQERSRHQGLFEFMDPPTPVLRSLRVAANERARANREFPLFANMRIPEESVIFRSFHDSVEYSEAYENLSWWEGLEDKPIRVQTRKSSDGLDVIITPA